MTLTEGKKTDKQLWNTLMIIVHIVTESLCKLETSFKREVLQKTLLLSESTKHCL